MIIERARQIQSLADHVASLSHTEAKSALAAIHLIEERCISTCGAEARTYDASDASRESVVQWLMQLAKDSAKVDVVWYSVNEGLSMLYSHFVCHYDQLWFPGADDVAVVDANRSWVLLLDHEEQFIFKRP